MQFNFYYRATATSHCSGLHFDPLSFTAALQVFGSAALFMHSSLSSGLWTVAEPSFVSFAAVLGVIVLFTTQFGPSFGRGTVHGDSVTARGWNPSITVPTGDTTCLSWYDVFDFTHTCCTWWTNISHLFQKSPEALQTWSLLPSSFWRDVFSSKQATLVQSSSNCSVMNFDL